MQLKMDVYTDCGKKEKKQTTLCLSCQCEHWSLKPVVTRQSLASPNHSASQMEILAPI